MKIEGNQKELDAMVEFHKGNRVEGLRLQEEFAAEFRKEYKDKLKTGLEGALGHNNTVRQNSVFLYGGLINTIRKRKSR